jgi:hypothetical protein
LFLRLLQLGIARTCQQVCVRVCARAGERDSLYIQLLIYPNGFTRGDGSLRYIPRSHTICPNSNRAKNINAGPPERPGQLTNPLSSVRLGVEEPSLPPGSMVLINART